MKLSEIGEFGLIQRIAQRVAREPRPISAADTKGGFELLLDIGDDTAAWRSPKTVALFTTDTLVEGVHFLPHNKIRVPWHDLGWKAIAVNLSDIAAMGGTPLYALITLGLPNDTEIEDVDTMYDGMLEACSKYGAYIVGGDIVQSPTFFVTVALTGTTSHPLLTRSGARAGHHVAVTGHLGASVGGLRMLSTGLSLDTDSAKSLWDAHFRPQPRLAEGQLLTRQGVPCAIDVSDGLVDDLSKICQASSVSATIFASKVPVHPAVKKLFPQECLEMALSGGEDYELLFTAPSKIMDKTLPLLPTPSTFIGKITEGSPGKVSVLDDHGREMEMKRGGWDHFR